MPKMLFRRLYMSSFMDVKGGMSRFSRYVRRNGFARMLSGDLKASANV